MADSSVVAGRFRLGWRVAGIIMVGIVWWGCLTPTPPDIPQPFDYFDKVEHCVAYLLLAAWFAAIYARRRQRLVILISLIVMGGLIEILQHYTGRDAEWFDWFADIIGALLGLSWPARWLSIVYARLAENHVQSG